METTGTFAKLVDAWAQDPRYIDDRGGTRSGKTYSALQLLTLVSMTDVVPTITSVVSETLPHLKKGAIRDFKDIMGTEHWWDPKRWNASECFYTFSSGSIIEFFGADSPSKVMGPGRHRLFLNEANHIGWETARQLFVRTRDRIIYDYNPAGEFWGTNPEIWATRPGRVSINSTYLDNQFLTPEQVAEIEANKGDKNWWNVYGLGLMGRLEGLVYNSVELIDEMPPVGNLRECYGLDYGFSNSTTALLHLLIDEGRRRIYVDQIIYQKGILNSDIAELMTAAGVPKKRVRAVPIYADAAEPKSNAELCRYGWNVLGCDKTNDSDRHNPITAQIGMITPYTICITKRSVDTKKEIDKYMWATNKDGERLNVPVKVNDHAMDAMRYAAYSELFSNKSKGKYYVSVIQKN